MFQFMNITKALSDENRVRILMALHESEELCVCHINDLLQLAPSTVSKHLFLLKNARLVEAHKRGRWVHYRLNRHPGPREMVAKALEWIVASNSEDAVIQADRDRLTKILAIELTNACQRQQG